MTDLTPLLNTRTLDGPHYPPTWDRATALRTPGTRLLAWLPTGGLIVLRHDADWRRVWLATGHVECYVAPAEVAP